MTSRGVFKTLTHEISKRDIFEFTLQCEVNIYSSIVMLAYFKQSEERPVLQTTCIGQTNDVLSEFMS